MQKTSHSIALVLVSLTVFSGSLAAQTKVLESVSTDPVFSKMIEGFVFYPKVFKQTSFNEKDETLRLDRPHTSYHLLGQSGYRNHWIPNGGWSHWIDITIENDSKGKFLNVRNVSFSAFRNGDSIPCFITQKVLRLNKKGEVIELVAARGNKAPKPTITKPSKPSD